MKPPNNESVTCKDFEQLRRGDWLIMMRLTRTRRQNNANRIYNETNQQKEHRLQTNREYAAILFQNETNEDRGHRLQQQRQNHASRIQNKTDEQRQQRLQRLRQNNTSRIRGGQTTPTGSLQTKRCCSMQRQAARITLSPKYS